MLGIEKDEGLHIDWAYWFGGKTMLNTVFNV
jgi:hypothetical protein